MTGVDLVTFLRARLDEREAAARKAASGCGCHPPAPSWAFDDEATDGRIVIVNDPHPDVPRKLTRRWNGSYDGLFHATHIALNDPQFVLADVAAKREILDVCENYIGDGATSGADLGRQVVRLLAESFESHPDFDPAWIAPKPEA